MRVALPEAVEAIGAIQAQFRPAIAAALYARVEGLDVGRLHDAFEKRDLVVGTLLRSTIHAVAAREHAYYTEAVEASGAYDWRRAKSAHVPEMERLRRDLHEFASIPRKQEELVEFVNSWIGRHDLSLDPGELERQQQLGWRPVIRWARLIRVASNGSWTSSRPSESLAAPPSSAAPSAQEAVDHVVRAHLRAFGPASAADVAAWTALRVSTVKAALDRLAGELARFEDEAGRQLFDLAGAPHADPESAAPARLLPWFDSVLLAYEPAQRARILPPGYRERVYVRSNLQWLPTILVDGFVAGRWSAKLERRRAAITLDPFVKLAVAARKELEAEAEGLLRILQPDAHAYEVRVQSK
jgi:Winged helix DNA-binding domain